MTFKESITTCLTKYAVFTGRAPRSEYWWFVLAQLLIGFGIGFIGGFLGIDMGGLSLIAMLVMFLPGLAVAIRRLHDLGKSGWFYLLIFIPIIGALVLLYWFVQPSAPETNEYGAAPVL
ncbi:MAG: DUF805 domain-containing protein [Sulfuricurvum sp.]|uniref:DUF805 domain-containing protein n=1 Tax=Sulfuricurvum sp. TaxID=2025608 RepID=UPI0026033139|nr:DUF805 domain-containing protein [Sulfuricurvum sp.]MDD5160630.1 DUF805 domain-containing protein [Sulfuricurvum sp.]